MKKERILITGGAGYLGSVMIPELLAAGHAVTVVDTFARGDTDLALACGYDDFEAVRADARDESVMKPLLAKTDVVLPLAALVGAPLCARDPIGATTINRDAILMLIKNMSKQQKLLYPTTNSGYGVGEAGTFCTEESPLRPVSLYGTTKVEAERAVLDSGIGLTFRLATVFGMAPRMRIDLLVNDFTLRAVTDRAVVIFEGHFKRNFIHVRDIARVFMHGIQSYEKMRGEAFNVGLSDANLSKLELCERIKQHVPGFVIIESPIGEDPDKRDYIVSNAKIEATGFQQEWPLDRGIHELIKGYKMLNTKRFSNV